MAVPKRKQSKARRDKRRSNVWKLEAPTLVKCPQCGELKVPHQVCGKCGYYKGGAVPLPFSCLSPFFILPERSCHHAAASCQC